MFARLRRVDRLDIAIYGLAVAWLLFLALLPPTAFLHLGPAYRILAYKNAWLWPALGGVLLPAPGWIAPWRWARYVIRLYQVGYWLFLATATLLVTPVVVVFWLPALLSAGGVLFLLAREGADARRADEAEG
jgi:hypothetical protein